MKKIKHFVYTAMIVLVIIFALGCFGRILDGVDSLSEAVGQQQEFWRIKVGEASNKMHFQDARESCFKEHGDGAYFEMLENGDVVCTRRELRTKVRKD